MTLASQRLAPKPLEQLDPADLEGATEVRQLLRLAAAGLPLAPLRLVPAALEERFYHLNNLPERLQRLFESVDPQDPDEDDIEELAPLAAQLFKTHYLLDEFIDAFYEALKPLPTRLRLRHPGTAGRTALKGRPAILALKEVWADAWTFEAVSERLRRTGTIALEARPVLVGPAFDEPADAAFAERVRQLLGEATPVFVTPDQGVTRLAED